MVRAGLQRIGQDSNIKLVKKLDELSFNIQNKMCEYENNLYQSIINQLSIN